MERLPLPAWAQELRPGRIQEPRPGRIRALRASDADRERAVAVLREAAADGRLTLTEHEERVERAYGARTIGELADLTGDLLDAAAQPMQVDFTPPLALFRGHAKKGRWVVPARFSVSAFFGDVYLDFQHALLERREVVVNAVAICGSVTFIVPDGLDVRISGPVAIGSKASHVHRRATPGGPVIHVHARVVCGSVTAKGPPRSRFRRRSRSR